MNGVRAFVLAIVGGMDGALHVAGAGVYAAEPIIVCRPPRWSTVCLLPWDGEWCELVPAGRELVGAVRWFAPVVEWDERMAYRSGDGELVVDKHERAELAARRTTVPERCAQCGLDVSKGMRAQWKPGFKLLCWECRRALRKKIVQLSRPTQPERQLRWRGAGRGWNGTMVGAWRDMHPGNEDREDRRSS
jgi:hypothetical protein